MIRFNPYMIGLKVVFLCSKLILDACDLLL